ncbi:hypothetical protein Plec18167_003344 [Paecilomyces lecythidis]|uniref:Uncharacterized protein n=1 Tax=Paecilomyces lecythidis TaxID=3004212 RepID=A0ABR3Y196_9EURO
MELMPQAAKVEGKGDGEKQRERAISPSSSSRPGQVSLCCRVLHRNITSPSSFIPVPVVCIVTVVVSLTATSSASQIPLLLRCGCGSSSRPLPVAQRFVRNALVRQLLVARINKKHGCW